MAFVLVGKDFLETPLVTMRDFSTFSRKNEPFGLVDDGISYEHRLPTWKKVLWFVGWLLFEML